MTYIHHCLLSARALSARALQTGLTKAASQRSGWAMLPLMVWAGAIGSGVGGMIVGGMAPAMAEPAPDAASTANALNPCPGIYYEEPHNHLHIVPKGCPPNLATRNLQARRLAQANAADSDTPNLFELERLPLVEGALVLPVLQPNVAFADLDLGEDAAADNGPIYDGIGGAYGSLPENSVGLTRPRAVGQSVASQRPLTGADVTVVNDLGDSALPLPEVQQVAIAQVTPEPSGHMALQLTNNTTTDIAYEVITHSPTRVLAPGESVLLKDLPTPVTITMVRPDGGFLRVTPLENTTGKLALDLSASGQFDNIQGALTIQADGQVFLD